MLSEYWSIENDEDEIKKFRLRYEIEPPDECPICHSSIEPKYIIGCVGYLDGDYTKRNQIRVVFQCPKKSCQELFIGHYRNQIGSGWYEFFKCVPMSAETRKFKDVINELSPRFEPIYNQALEAEAAGLHEICGMGYRKALEFLVKDYLVKQYPEREAEIKKLLLKPCITEYVKDQHIKDLAERAGWLGNDETHYVRKWADKDLTDLKTLIELVKNKIESDLLYDKYLAEMPVGKK